MTKQYRYTVWYGKTKICRPIATYPISIDLIKFYQKKIRNFHDNYHNIWR